MKRLPTLFSRTSSGAIQEWDIEIDGNKYRTVYGQTDGKKITTEWTVAQPTNVGRANERDGEKQALFEAKALWKKKKESGYWENVGDIDKAAFVEPMLAQKYEDRIDELTFPLYVQPKLDGIRCVTMSSGMQSRNGKPIVSCLHIINKLRKAGVFKQYPDLKLDGELYCDKLNNDFNKITSLVKKSKPTENDLMEADATIQYWIYDMVDTDSIFSDRHAFLVKLFKEFKLDSSFVLVPTFKIDSLDEGTKLYEQWIEDGYEGGMYRLNEPYEQKRSKNLLKRKDFQDREYPIVGVFEGEGNKTGMAGYMVLRNDDGETFRSNIKGNRDYLRSLLRDADKLVGRQATVKFFNLTPDKKVPRFPYIIKIREDFDV
jgi:DNA ligase-1